MSFLSYEKVPYFNGFESTLIVLVLLLFMFGLMMSAVFFREGLKRALTPWALAHIYFCIFLVTIFVTSENLLVFLFTCESFIWLNFYRLNFVQDNRRSLYFQSFASTGILLVLTVFLGLLENISLSEITYNIENLSKISLSYVSGTIYSTQTLFFIMALFYIVLKISFLLHVLILKLFEKSIKVPELLLIILGIPTIIYCFYSQQFHFYGLAYEEYGGFAIGFCILFIFIFHAFQFQNYISSWSKKWTD